MDINTALMESITSMSEYFVAANTRTSFMDIAESASLGSFTGQSTPHSSSSGMGQQNNNNNHESSQSNLNQQFPSSPTNSTHHKALSATTTNHLNQQLQQHSNNSQNSSPLSHSPCNHNNQHGYNSVTSGHSRLSQPMRTQIPIHCYIEQLDACADINGFDNSSLNDHDLFNTTSKSSTSQLISHTHQPYLNQSKLALESVTNCNGNSSLSALANSSSLFDENDDNNDSGDLDAVDANLDHLNSPLSINQHSTLSPSETNNDVQTNSICGIPNSHQASSSSYDNNHQYQSCRERYAIVTSNVLYIDLVRTVLLQLGYSAMDLINAKATIQIKNWKPLALDQVTEDKRATVGEVLGDISTFVTLRIRLYSAVTQLPTEWTETMIRQVVLALTQTMSQLTLSKLCNISQPLISSIVRGGKKLGRRKCAEFGQWYMNYIKSAEARPSTMFCESGSARLVFDKSREIPQLKAWFANNTKPSEELLEEYSRILNEHALRKDRPQVTAKALKNWWKNERQKLGIRQREIRGRPKLKRID